ncbi:MAG TPA: HAMP domain-containing protein, partial [Thermoanaerobaculia bacterium]
MSVANQKSTGTRMGLRTKFVTAFALQAIVIAVLLAILQYLLVSRAMVGLTVQQGSAIAETVKATAGYYVIFGLTDDLKKIVTDLKKNPSVEYAEFLDANGKVLAASSGQQAQGLAGRVLERERGALLRAGVHIYNEPFFETEADANNPKAKPKGYFRLLMNESQADRAIASLIRWNAGTTLLVLLGAVLLSWLASRLIVKPVLALVTTAGQISKGDLTQRASVSSGDEIGVLAGAFNDMTANLERTVKSLVQSQTQLKDV